MKTALKDLLEGISAGFCIILGCAVFLALPELKYIGAVLFSVALFCICYKGYNLFTGRIGFIPEKHDKSAISSLLLGLLGNVIATTVFGLLLRVALPVLGDTAQIICQAKLTQTVWQTLIRGMFCGALMYLAVSTFKESKTVLGIVLCVAVFILSGFEHSIADMGYFAVSGIFSIDAFLFILLVIVGNAVGAMILPTLRFLCKDKVNKGE